MLALAPEVLVLIVKVIRAIRAGDAVEAEKLARQAALAQALRKRGKFGRGQ